MIVRLFVLTMLFFFFLNAAYSQGKNGLTSHYTGDKTYDTLKCEYVVWREQNINSIKSSSLLKENGYAVFIKFSALGSQKDNDKPLILNSRKEPEYDLVIAYKVLKL